jgi:hypothetical protein
VNLKRFDELFGPRRGLPEHLQRDDPSEEFELRVTFEFSKDTTTGSWSAVAIDSSGIELGGGTGPTPQAAGTRAWRDVARWMRNHPR